jgi:hypothetical protein
VPVQADSCAVEPPADGNLNALIARLHADAKESMAR